MQSKTCRVVSIARFALSQTHTAPHCAIALCCCYLIATGNIHRTLKTSPHTLPGLPSETWPSHCHFWPLALVPSPLSLSTRLLSVLLKEHPKGREERSSLSWQQQHINTMDLASRAEKIAHRTINKGGTVQTSNKDLAAKQCRLCHEQLVLSV